MAKKKKINIFSDPRYKAFRRRYRGNLVRFVIECLGKKPTWQQLEVLESFQEPGSRTAVCSGHGTGKSAAFAWAAIWLLFVYIFSNTIVTANNLEQVRSVVWKEIKDSLPSAYKRHPWLSDYFIIETKRFYAKGFKDQWFVQPRTAPTHKPEGLAGQHRKWLTYLIDEASAFDDGVMDVIEGALTDEHNRLLMMSQGTRPIGRFAEAFGKLKDVIYTAIRMNSELSPLVSKKFIREKLIQYGGHHSPEYAIRVLGLHPDNLAGYLIPATWVRDAQNNDVVHSQPWGWVLLADVSEGVNRDESILLHAKISGYGQERIVEGVMIEEFGNIDPKKFGKIIWQRSLDYRNCTIGVDADGPGLATCLEIEELGGLVQRIHWGRAPHSKAQKRRFQDLRAVASLGVRNSILEGRMHVTPGEKIVEQASKIPYDIDRYGRYVIMSKKDMRSKGIKSPDVFDTYCFSQLVDYVPADIDYGTDEDEKLRTAALNALQKDLKS